MEADERLYRRTCGGGEHRPAYSTPIIILALMTAQAPNTQRPDYGNTAVQEVTFFLALIKSKYN